jgi:hypothetical protein
MDRRDDGPASHYSPDPRLHANGEADGSCAAHARAQAAIDLPLPRGFPRTHCRSRPLRSRSRRRRRRARETPPRSQRIGTSTPLNDPQTHRPIADLLCGRIADEPAPDLFSDVELAMSERPGPGDGISRAAVPGGFCLEQSQHPLRTVRGPRRDDPPIGFAQRLWRRHSPDLPTHADAPFRAKEGGGQT